MLVQFTRPDRSKVWINSDAVHLVREPFSFEDGSTVIVHHSGNQCVNEPIGDVIQALSKASKE
jgi:hypothetical protein